MFVYGPMFIKGISDEVLCSKNRFSHSVAITALIVSAIAAAPAMAQDVAAVEEDVAEDSIVVTGTRIARPNLESAVPITSISVEIL